MIKLFKSKQQLTNKNKQPLILTIILKYIYISHVRIFSDNIMYYLI